jgi:hypothetical protein
VKINLLTAAANMVSTSFVLPKINLVFFPSVTNLATKRDFLGTHNAG